MLTKDKPWFLLTYETHQRRTLGLTSVWRTNQGRVRPGFWRDSLRADLRFDEPDVRSARTMLLHMCYFLEWHVLQTCRVWRIDLGIICPGFWRDSPRANLGFYEPSVRSARAMLLHTCHFMEWHVLETWCVSLLDSTRENFGFCKPFGETTNSTFVLGFGEIH